MPPRRCVVQYCSRVSDKELGISVQSSLEYCKSFGLQIGYYRETKMIIRMVDTTFTLRLRKLEQPLRTGGSLVEHLAVMREVMSSTPAGPTLMVLK